MTHTVTIASNGITFEAREDETIMAAAMRSGYRMRGICGSGGCCVCKAFLAKGTIRRIPSQRLRQSDIDAGVFLTCCAYALTDVTIETYCRKAVFS